MKSTRWLALSALTIIGASVAATGCGDSGTGGTGGSNTGGATSSSASTGKGVSVSSSGTGMMMGNHSFDTATDIDVNPMSNTAGTLVDVDTGDYYKFTGTAGERITAVINAQQLAGTTGDDDTVIDPVVTIFDANKVQIAQDDDEWYRFGRDAQVFTTLPADGTYYLVVQDCNAAFPNGGCADPTAVSTFDYEAFVADVSNLNAPEVNEGSAANDTQAQAVNVSYAVPTGGMMGDYGTYIIDGAFSAASDTDFFSFTPPSDTTVDMSARARAEFFVQPITATNGDGSKANVLLSVIDSNGNTVAQVDQANYADGDSMDNGPIDMSVPVTLGDQYFLKVQISGAATSEISDFYYMSHFVGSFFFGQLEASDLANNLPATAETLTTPSTVTAQAFFVDGDITTPGVDTDWYSMTISGSPMTASLFCDAQRAGSGLRGAKFGLYDSTGATKLGEFTEVANKETGLFGMSAVTLPANTTKLLLKVEAASQDATVTGTYYHCSVNVQ